MSFRRNVWILYWVIFFESMIPAYVIERLYWQGRGMSIAQVVACEVIYAVVIVVLEVPSGVLADLLGRKAMLMVGALTAVLEFGLLLGATQFWQFGLAVLLTGIGKACVSGSWNALLYDSLALSGQADRFERHLGRIRAVDAVGTLVAGLLGSYLAHRFTLELPYWVSVCSCALSFLCTLALVEPPTNRERPRAERETVRSVLRRARDFFRTWPDALAILVHATAIAAFIVYVDELWQLYLQDVSFPVLLFGVVSAAIAGMRVLGSSSAVLFGRMGTRRAMLLLSALTAAGLLAAAWISTWVGIIPMAICCAAGEVMQVLSMGYTHHRADSAARATIESAGSLMQRVVTIGLGILFAAIAGQAPLRVAYAVLAALCVLMTVGFAAWYARIGRARKEELNGS